MNFKLLLAALAFLLIASCMKNSKCQPVNHTAPAAEVDSLKAYLQANSITATQDPRGFFYTIVTPGSTSKPNACANVGVTYTGKLTNGNTFDSGSSTFSLSDLIIGWQEGIPLVGKGGRIILYLPPGLGYGSQTNGPIPGNSILIFTIDLIDFTNP